MHQWIQYTGTELISFVRHIPEYGGARETLSESGSTTIQGQRIVTGKGEKNPGEGSEREPETMSPQQVGAVARP